MATITTLDDEGLSCHHGDDPDGHPLAADCPVQVKRGNYGRPSLRTLVESGQRADVRAAHRELRARLRCVAVLDSGEPCTRRATLYPALYCGVHG